MKKYLSLLLALCLVFTLAAPALAEGVLAEAPLTAPAAPAEGADMRRMANGPVTVNDADGLQKALDEAEKSVNLAYLVQIQLGQDITLTKPLTLAANKCAYLYLQEHTLTAAAGARHLEVSGTLIIVGNGKLDGGNAGGGVVVKKGGTADLKSMSIVNCKSGGNGGGVYVEDGGSLMSSNASVQNCTAANGGGVYVGTGGSLSITHATIERCTAATAGGGVYAADGGQIKGSGSSAIKGNKVGEKNDNLALEAGAQVRRAGDIWNGEIGISLYGDWPENAVILMDNFGNPLTGTDLNNFKDDTTSQPLTSSMLKDGGIYTGRDPWPILVDTVELNLPTLTVQVGDTAQLTANAAPENATDKTLTWATSDDTVAAVDSSGKVTGVSEGSATITATAIGGAQDTCTVTVAPLSPPDPPVTPVTPDTAIALDKTKLSLEPGQTAKLKASLTPADATYKYIFWTSSDETVATVSDSGLVTAMADGTATITAKSWYGHEAVCTVTVKTPDEPTPPDPVDPWPTEGLEGFVTRCYRVALSRDPDKAGHADWVRWLKDGTVDATSCTYGFVFSKEMNNKKLSDEAFVKTLYNLFMDREGEATGVAFWTKYLKDGHSRLEVFNGFTDSVEFARIKSSYGIR